MIKIENIDVWGFEHAVRGMRNPMNSWNKSDSHYVAVGEKYDDIKYQIGEADLDLMKRLLKAGSEHRKYLRQIMISMDITAPLYWWKEFDTYKVGTVANSCSTMHKIHNRDLTLEDFSTDHLTDVSKKILQMTIDHINTARIFCTTEKTFDKTAWWQMIQLLPSSYNQRRTVTMNYENAVTIYNQRAGHKLDEWLEFRNMLYYLLPYFKELIED